MADSRQLPEFARSLRTFGAQSDAAGDAAHAAIFQPLLDARARAVGATPDIILAALRGDALSARIEALAVDAAVQGIVQPAQIRAVTAQTGEAVEPLRDALLALDAAVAGARESEAGWAAWVSQLRKVFTTADLVCQTLAKLLAAHARPPGRVERRLKKR